MTSVRIVAEYQMFGDMEGGAWARLVLGEAKTKGLIGDYAVTGVYPGRFGLELICFTVDVPCAGAFDESHTYDEHMAAALDLLNGPVIQDSDVDVRWLTPVPEDTLPRDEDGRIETSAVYGQSCLVRILHTTDHDGRVLGDDEDLVETLHGPFVDAAEAKKWIDAYPEFTDIEDFYVRPLNSVRP